MRKFQKFLAGNKDYLDRFQNEFSYDSPLLKTFYVFRSEDSFKKRQLREGDIIFEISGGSTNQSTGRTTIITDHILNAYDTPLVYSNFCRILRFRDMQNSIYHYLKLTTCYNNDEFFAWEVGTTAIKNFPFTFFSKIISKSLVTLQFLKCLIFQIQANI